PITAAFYHVISCVHQGCQSVPSVRATHQCHPSVPPTNAHQCSIISASSSMPTCDTSSVSPHQCSLSVLISVAYPCHLISAHKCCLSVPP
ncbi:unnamed protein product, partial [Staurois parvus]